MISSLIKITLEISNPTKPLINQILREITIPYALNITSRTPLIPNPRNPHHSYLHARIKEFPTATKALKKQYNGKFFIKYLGEKIKAKFENLEYYNNFKDYCLRSKIQFHNYLTEQDKILAVVLRGFSKIIKDDLIQVLLDHNLKALSCNEIQRDPNYLYQIYKLTFSLDITLQHLMRILSVFQTRVYWEKYNNSRTFIQCFRCQAHGHTSANCSKTFKYVKCVLS